MSKRKRVLGKSVLQSIKDEEVIQVLRPHNATKILKKILEYDYLGEFVTSTKIARELGVSTSTVTRNIERFNTFAYLVTTEQKGNQFIIQLTEKGRKIAKIIENSESIDLMEKDREGTINLISLNKKLANNLNSTIIMKKSILEELNDRVTLIKDEIKMYIKENSMDSIIKRKELELRLLSIENEIYEIKNDLKSKMIQLNDLKKENNNLQKKLDDFLVRGDLNG